MPLGLALLTAALAALPLSSAGAQAFSSISTCVTKGDRVLIEVIDASDEFTIELMRAVRAAGGDPLVEVRHTRVNREMLRGTNRKHASLIRDLELRRMKKMQA